MSSMNIYVGNISFQTTDDDLSELFAQYGSVVSAKVITDRYSGQSRGFGFVEMAERGEGEQAVAELNGKEVMGRQIKVNEAKPRSNEGRRDNFRGGGGGGGRRY